MWPNRDLIGTYNAPMLAELVPGIRNLRAPLVAGVMWLIVGWLALYGTLGLGDPQKIAGPKWAELFDHLGRPGTIAILGVVTYLVGSVSVSLVRGLMLRLNLSALEKSIDPAGAHRVVLRYRGLKPFGRYAQFRAYQAGVQAYEQASASHPDLSLRATATDVARGVLRDTMFIDKRLLAASEPLYNEYSRYRAEAEFRDAILLPALPLLVATLANLNLSVAEETIGAFAFLTLLIAVFVQARNDDREANSILAHAVADGLIATAVMEAANDGSFEPGMGRAISGRWWSLRPPGSAIESLVEQSTEPKGFQPRTAAE